MEVIEVKTSELIGPALDWAVAKAVGEPVTIKRTFSGDLRPFLENKIFGYAYEPSTDWADGGPLLDRNPLQLPYASRFLHDKFSAMTDAEFEYGGPTALIAACRAIVACKLGATVSVPAELITTAAPAA